MNESKHQGKLQQLCCQLREEYQAVETLIGEVKTRRDGDLDVASLTNIRNRLTTIKRIESEFGPIRDQVMARGEVVPEKLKNEVEQTIAIITRLIPGISEIEQVARDSHQRLGPRIHEAVRGLQMQNAYRRTTTP